MQNSFLISCGHVLFKNMQFSCKHCGDGVSTWAKFDGHITKYGSTLCIGMDEVLPHYVCTFENSALHFHFH